MNINFKKFRREIIGLIIGSGYTVSMYDDKGKGPIASSELAKYVYLDELGMIIKMPDDYFDEDKELIIYKSGAMGVDEFYDFFQMIKSTSVKNGISVTVRSFTSEVIPRHISGKIKAEFEEQRSRIQESWLDHTVPHLINFID